jgi:peptide subunit release factor 1 (eRF1)
MTDASVPHGDLKDILRRLAEFEPAGLPVLSIYLDIRPQATGNSPGRRAGLTVLRDRLREIESTYWPRGDDFDSFAADRERIEAFIDSEADPSAHGLAIFACHGADLWEVVEAGVPFRDSVSAGPVPDLFQLARLLDQEETAVVAVVDSNTARLFVTRAGLFEEVDGPDEPSVSYRKRSMGGWSQARYQRHIDKHRIDFAREAAAEVEALVEREGARRVILAGDEVAITPLTDHLSPAVKERVQEIARIDIKASSSEVIDEIRPVLERIEAEDGTSVADRLIDAVRAGRLGVTGVEPVRAALDAGAVDTLVLLALPGRPPVPGDAQDARDLAQRGEIQEEAESADLDLDARNELVRMAALTAADVEVVDEHEALEHAGGVGALLRYQLP